eukprot:2402892-Rhodomonas_salina.2
MPKSVRASTGAESGQKGSTGHSETHLTHSVMITRSCCSPLFCAAPAPPRVSSRSSGGKCV